jgi:hypothetical protein
LLDQAIEAAGLARRDVFITNAVKHFKWEPRGKRRLHKKPGVGEIKACNIWLDQEIRSIQPKVIVALGATALRALANCGGFSSAICGVHANSYVDEEGWGDIEFGGAPRGRSPVAPYTIVPQHGRLCLTDHRSRPCIASIARQVRWDLCAC